MVRRLESATTARVASGLLRIAADFGLLNGGTVKEFASYHLPDESFIYLLHAIAELEPNARRMIESPEWRMYLMDAEDVEREILRLHQFRRGAYEVAGSLARLDSRRHRLEPTPGARGMTDDWKTRLTERLEPILTQPDPRPQISAYHDMPYAIFRYPPEDEFAVRRGDTARGPGSSRRASGSRRISLAECLHAALEAEGPRCRGAGARPRSPRARSDDRHDPRGPQRVPAAGRPGGGADAQDPDPLRDVVFIIRTAHCSRSTGRSRCSSSSRAGTFPTVLFYPGDLDGAAGLRFMGVLDAEHNYRPKIF